MSPQICVVMAVFRPDPDHLRQQLKSIAGQSLRPARLVLVIADMESAELADDLARAEGIVPDLVLPPDRLDAVRAFEAGLVRALDLTGHEDLIALSDQDDLWHPDRLESCAGAMADPQVQLVHSDARLVDDEGRELHRSMFAFEKRHKSPGLRGLLYRNNVTGMTALMRRRVVALALPFPPQSGVHYYHDLWLALIAAALGRVALIDRPLVDYRQHGANAIGAVNRQQKVKRERPRITSVWLRREAAGYGLARYLAKSLYSRLAEAVSANQLEHGQSNTGPLRPFLKIRGGMGGHVKDALRLLVTGHPGLARIAGGFALVNAGRLTWSLRHALGPGLMGHLEAFDERLYQLSPGVSPRERVGDTGAHGAASDRARPASTILDTRKIPGWVPKMSAPEPALNVLVPSLNPTEVFAGIATAVDIGVGLAARGHRVRLIATDLPVSSPDASRHFVLDRLPAGAGPEVADRIEISCGVMAGQGRAPTLPSHPDDLFLATAWWSAHVIRRLIGAHGYTHERFLYLIQDFEPNFYPWGGEFADAYASYGMNVLPIFNTALLRDYFAAQGLTIATPDALAFRPSIDISRYSRRARPAPVKDAPRRLVFYGRPEVARNMFPTAIEALSRFIEAEDLGPDNLEAVSVGLVHAPVRLSGGITLRSLGKLPWEEYPKRLLQFDLGLSLMYSPHPSHPPLEMAASGVRVVTNRFGPKDLSRLSPAILSASAEPGALASALSKAWHMGPVEQHEREIDLSPLGLTMPALLDELSERITPLIPACEAS